MQLVSNSSPAAVPRGGEAPRGALVKACPILLWSTGTPGEVFLSRRDSFCIAPPSLAPSLV